MTALPVFHDRADRFEEWRSVPLPPASSDPRFEVRRASRADGDRIFDLVDETFGTKRPRAAYEWLYHRNPNGMARSWLLLEKATGALVACQTEWPWPVALGAEPLAANQAGDWVVAPNRQRQGLNAILATVRLKHPWAQEWIQMSWPNEKSRGSSKKRGRGRNYMGPLPRGVMPLRSHRHLQRRGWPPALATAAGAASDAALRAWQLRVRFRRPEVTIEPVRRFDAAVDAVTARRMGWPGFWCPHDAAFLNWRYLDHPAHEYVGFTATTREGLDGYCVVRIGGAQAWLMEFVAPQAPPFVASALLIHAADTARAAGCESLLFMAPPVWRHWPLFRSLGLVPRSSDLVFFARGLQPGIRQLENWQWVAGDIDIL